MRVTNRKTIKIKIEELDYDDIEKQFKARLAYLNDKIKKLDKWALELKGRVLTEEELKEVEKKQEEKYELRHDELLSMTDIVSGGSLMGCDWSSPCAFKSLIDEHQHIINNRKINKKREDIKKWMKSIEEGYEQIYNLGETK